MVYWNALGSKPATVALKYVGQALRTWRTLRAERPQAVLVMSPPVIAVIAVWLYAALARVPFVIDAHTAAFMHPRWRRLQWLQRAMSRRAATTIVTNDHLAEPLRAAGAHVTIMRDVPVVFPPGGRFERDSRFSVAAICSFNDDEPVTEMVQAAASLPDVAFYVTGDAGRIGADLRARFPPNLRLTGFLPDADYGHLVSTADAVLTLTTRNHTMLRGAYEAIYQGTPVIVSDWPLLRAAFDSGALHVDNTADGIVSAVRTMQIQHDTLRDGARQLRQRKLDLWDGVRATLLARIAPRGDTMPHPPDSL